MVYPPVEAETLEEKGQHDFRGDSHAVFFNGPLEPDGKSAGDLPEIQESRLYERGGG